MAVDMSSLGSRSPLVQPAVSGPLSSMAVSSMAVSEPEPVSSLPVSGSKESS
jgi:hypothetical protein